MKFFALQLTMLVLEIFSFAMLYLILSGNKTNLKEEENLLSYKKPMQVVVLNADLTHENPMCKTHYHPVHYNNGYLVRCEDNSIIFTTQPFIVKEN